MRALSIAVIGHVDHGKTSLVKALTGKETDRLAEERVRGMSIVPGYALMRSPDVEIDLIDAPGHERFVRAIIAAAGGVGAVLLVVAASEGVMPQTLEHLEIARLLGVKRGVVALTKSDLVDTTTLAERRRDIEALVATYGLGEARIIATALPSGAGCRDLASAIADLAPHAQQLADDGFPYLPIDRVFAIPGFGPVATGTLRRGSIRVGDELELGPGGPRVRVRSLQTHDRAVKVTAPGRRVAAALRGVDLKEIRRGMSLAPPGRLVCAEWLDVEVQAALSADAPLRDGQRLRLLSGTSEADCRLRLLDGAEVAPGVGVLAQLRFDAPIALPAREAFILRRLSPPATLGGGIVLAPLSRRRRRGALPASLLAQARGDLTSAVLERLREAGSEGEFVDMLALQTGLDGERLTRFLVKSGAMSAGASRAHDPALLVDMLATLRDAVDAHHRLRPLETGLPLDQAARALPAGAPLEALAAALVARREGVIEKGALRRSDFKPGQAGSADLAARLAEELRAAGLTPPDEAAFLHTDAERRDALRFLVDQAICVRARDRVQNRVILFHRDAIGAAKARLASAYPARQSFLAREAGAALNISRKYSIPLLEHLDAIGFTQRHGDHRIVVAAADDIGGDRGLVAPLVFKTSGSPKANGGFDSHPPPPHRQTGSEDRKGS